MTRYTVAWVKSVEDRLIEIWLGSDEREAVTTATNRIEDELVIDAGVKGGELSEGLRYLEIRPLRIAFIVKEADRLVEVVSVRVVR